MGLPHLPYRCPRTYQPHRLSPVYWTSWELQPRAMQSGSSRRRRSPSLCPLFHRWSAAPNHNPTPLLASRRSGERSGRIVCAPPVHFFLFSFIEPILGQSPNPSAQSNVVSFCPEIVVIPPRLPSLRPHQLGSSAPVPSRLTRRQGLMGCRTSSSRQAMVECPSPLIQSALTLCCTQRPGES